MKMTGLCIISLRLCSFLWYLMSSATIFLKTVKSSHKFNAPHPTDLSERIIDDLENVINKVAVDHPIHDMT